MYNSIIIDDERLARLTLRKDLEKFSDITILGEASSIETAKILIEREKPDLLFLDIQLSDGNGFDLLNQVDYFGKIIFITAFDKFALRAFEVNAIDYLLKPVSLRRLRSAINKLSEKNCIKKEDFIELNYEDRLMLKHRNTINFIRLNTIAAICASREYSYIFTKSGTKYFASTSISIWEKRLPGNNFCRIHRSTIINFNYIIKIHHKINGTAEVIMQGIPEMLIISRNYLKIIKEKYGI